MSGMTSDRLEELHRIAACVNACAGIPTDKVALIRGPYRYGPYEYLYVNAQRIVACVHACDGIPTEALEAGVIRDLINAATRYLQITTWDTDDDPNCWFEEEFAKAWLREVLAKARGDK